MSKINYQNYLYESSDGQWYFRGVGDPEVLSKILETEKIYGILVVAHSPEQAEEIILARYEGPIGDKTGYERTQWKQGRRQHDGELK